MTSGHILVPVHIRWADIDAYGHVNNVAIATVLEEARIAVFWKQNGLGDTDELQLGLVSGPDAPLATLVGYQAIEYVAPIAFRTDPITVELWISKLGGASIDISYLVRDDNQIFARALTTLVMVDRSSGKPQKLDPDFRARALSLLDDAVKFRR